MLKVQLLKELSKRALCTVLSMSIGLSPMWAFGSETNMEALGKETQDYANELGQQMANQMPTLTGSQLNINLGNGKSMNLDTGELKSQSSNVKYQYTDEDIERIKSYYNDGTQLSERGEEEKEKLYANAASANPTVEGHAYAVIIDMANRDKVDMSKDPILDTSRDIYERIDEIAADLGSCKADTEFIDDSKTVHMPDYKQCSQVLDRSGSCKIYHSYRAGVLRHYDGPYNIDSCGEGCTTVWLGKVGNNYIPGGSCTLHTEEIFFVVTNPSAIIKAELDYAAYDDQMQVWIGPRGKEKKVYQGPRDTFPYEDYSDKRVPGVACELNTHWIWDPYRNGYGCTESACRYTQNNLKAIDITKHIKDAGKGGVVRFYLRDAIGGYGEAFARIRVYYDKNEAVHDEAWTPVSCLEAAYGVQDKFADGSVKCTSMPATDSKGCAWIDGVYVCPKHLNPSPLANIPNLCKEVQVNADFNFYKGEMDCWIDANGNKQCPVNNGGNLDGCQKYANDKQCGFISSECVDGAKGASGQCYVTDVTYDCGEDVLVSDTTQKTEYKCPGDISCMGNNCLESNTTISTSFGKVYALMNATQYMSQDMQCTGVDEDGNVTGDQNVSCSVFGGSPGQCKIAVGGWQDCCEAQEGIGLGTYIQMLNVASRLGSTLEKLESTGSAGGMLGDMVGAWKDMTGEVAEVVNKGMSYITKPFASYISNVGEVTSTTTDSIFSVWKDQLISKVKDVATEILTKALENTIFAEAGTGATSGAATQVVEGVANFAGTAMTVVGYVYMAYVVANMIVQIVYECTEEEYQTVSQNELKNCHYVGSYCRKKVLGQCIEKRRTYCCYQSPLSRIMSEQIRKQGDRIGVEFDGFGTAKAPKCDGIPLDKIDKIDWDQVDLSEWIAILESTGHFPNASNVDIDSLTGAGAPQSLSDDRLNTIDRTIDRLQGTDVDGLRNEGAKQYEVDTGYRGGQKYEGTP